MYVVIAWQDSGSTAEEVTAGNNAFLAVVKERSWVHPLSHVNLYVIRIKEATDQASIRDQCIGVCKTFPKMSFIITPALPPGLIQGWLDKDMWPKVNERTKE